MVGRKQEIRSLDEVMARKEAQFVAVYGRRRIGKTYLIRHYFNNTFTFYHTGEANVGMREQLQGFAYSLLDYGHKAPALQNWREAFRELRSLIENSKNTKKVIFIDEMPWMDTPRSNFLSALEHFWNSWGSSRDDLVLIVCGSASTWITNNILRNRGGLHNRVTDSIHLLPFTLSECEELTREMGLGISRQEICSLYMALGGVAHYWGFLKKGESADQSIDRLFFAENAKLRGEFDTMMASLFRKDEGCKKIVRALATKGIGLVREELLRRSGIEDGSKFVKTLDTLEQCGFVRRYAPFGKKLRGSVYQLIDSFSLFHERFVSTQGAPDEQGWSVGVSSREKDAWRGIAFERIALLHLKQIKKALGIGGIKTAACSWVHKGSEEYPVGAQIDLLIDRADKVINVCECKYASGLYTLTKDESESIENKVAALKAVSGSSKSVFKTIITTNGLLNNEYSRQIQNIVLLDSLFDD